jgi:hypothetical protein
VAVKPCVLRTCSQRVAREGAARFKRKLSKSLALGMACIGNYHLTTRRSRR